MHTFMHTTFVANILHIFQIVNQYKKFLKVKLLPLSKTTIMTKKEKLPQKSQFTKYRGKILVHSDYFRANCVQSFINILISSVYLFNVTNRTHALCRHCRNEQRHTCTDIG